MDGANTASAPTGTNTAIAPAASVTQAGAGHGGDNGVGFHSSQPVPSFINRDPTEQTATKSKLNQAEDLVDAFVPSHQRWLPSPFERYVPRPTSSGELPPGIPSYVPEDRSKMGVPLNPFWIRNGCYWDEGEADIFVDTNINWVAPRLSESLPQAPQGWDRDNYLNNEEQPQKSSAGSDIQKEQRAPPTASEAGSVTGTAEAAKVGQTKIEGANPAETGVADKTGKEATPKPEPKEENASTKRKKESKGPSGQKKAKATKPQ